MSQGTWKTDLTSKTDFVPGNFTNSTIALVKEETGQTNGNHITLQVLKYKVKRCTDLGYQVTQVTKLVPTILRWLLGFWKICIP
jgi:hypothetical protein